MLRHGGYLAARALKEAGVDVIFTLCGGHVAPIYDGCLDVGIRIVDFRHEQAAGHAADAWARLTGKVGVAVVTAGPGVTDVVTAVANAARANSPVLVIGGQGPLQLLDRGALQELDHVELLRPITKWARRVHETGRIPEYVAAAVRHALAGRPGPVFLEVPVDVLSNAEEEDAVPFPRGAWTEARPQGDPRSVSRAADLLARAERPVVMAGSAVWWCRGQAALRELAEAAQLPVFLNGMARGCLPSNHPAFFAHARGKALRAADVVLLVGTPLDFRLGYGQSIGPSARLVQIDLDAAEIGRNRGVDVGIPGDVGAILQQLAAAVRAQGPIAERGPWFEQLRAWEAQARAEIAPLLDSDQVPIDGFRLCRELRDFVDDDTILIGDGGDIVATAARVLEVNQPGHWLDPGPLGCLGVGMPFAIAAKLAHPEKEVVIIYGDGAFGLNGMEYDTAVRFRLPIIGVLGNDGMWGQIRRPQLGAFGPERAVATALALTRYDRLVEALGGHGEWVERPEEIRPALERARRSGRPALVNVRIDGEAPHLMGRWDLSKV